MTAAAPEAGGDLSGSTGSGTGTPAEEAKPATPWRPVKAKALPVRWLSPTELVRTGLIVLQGTIFARYADKRESMGSVPGHAFNLEKRFGEESDVWVDYVADIGDGFDATYAVACSITGAHRTVIPPSPGSLKPLGGCTCTQQHPATGDRLLVMGGDEVYPTASVAEYEVRTTPLYDAAWAASPGSDRSFAVAIPGNHDWYDGLVAFRRVFCESWIATERQPGFFGELPPERFLDRFAEWHTFQERSYFAVRLPHGWWLWGIDIQLDAPIDAAQLEYFRQARNLLNVEPDDRVILCTGRPSWVDPEALDGDHELSERQVLAWFVDRMFSDEEALKRVRLLISGDKHHYTRYSSVDPTESFSPDLVTCGGGGAFLSSTHHLPDEGPLFAFEKKQGLTLTDATYQAAEIYPKPGDSEEFRRDFWRIPLLNDNLPLLVTGIHAVLLWALSIGEGRSGWPHLGRLSWNPLHDRTWDTLGAFVPLMLVSAVLGYLLVAYAKAGAKPKTRKAWVCGLLHLLAHLVAVYALSAWLGPAAEAMWLNDQSWKSVIGIVILAGVALWVWGYVGAFIFAAYLRICDGLEHPLHENELFAGMRIEGYKSHLRIHVTREALHVRAVGLDSVPHEWVDHLDTSDPDQPVVYPRAVTPVLSREIDAFVVTRDPGPAA